MVRFRLKKATSFVVIVAMLSTLTSSCGGGGGGSSDSGSPPASGTVPTTGVTMPTTSVTGTVASNEVVESGLTVKSVFQETDAAITGAAFNTTVSTVGTQLLTVQDANKNLKGFTLSVIAPATKQANLLPIGAETTALTLLLLTPLLTTTNPDETQKRLSEFKQLVGFPALATYLRVNLPLKPLADVVKDPTCQALVNTCLEEYLASKSLLTTNLIGVVTASDGDFFIDKVDNSDQIHTKIPLVNFGLRYVNVYRRAVNQNGDEISMELIQNPMAGMDGASLGSLLTGTTGTPTRVVDTVDSSAASGVEHFEYWIVGPGFKTPTVQNIPPGVSTFDAGVAYNFTAVKYLVLPSIDIIFGGLDLAGGNDIKLVIGILEALKSMPEASQDLVAFKNASTSSEQLSALANLYGHVANELFFKILIEKVLPEKVDIIIGVAAEFAAPVAALAMASVGAGISAGNIAGFAYWTGKLPRIAMVRADVLNSGKPGAAVALLIDGQSSVSKPQGSTYHTTVTGLTPGGAVVCKVKNPNGTTDTLPTAYATSSGTYSWDWTSSCTTATGTYTLWAIDSATSRQSNNASEGVTSNQACMCPSGNGLYCGDAGLSQNTGWLYQCTNGSYSVSQQCSNGCQNNAAGTNDSCKSAPTINPTIAMSPMSGAPGTVFTEWGTGFTPNSTATFYFPKYDGVNNGTSQVSMDAQGHFEMTYPSGSNKPPGSYTWYAIDGPTGIKSNVVTYTVTVKPTIAMSPMSGAPGTVFTEWGTGFTPNSTATFYFPKYDGVNNGTSQVSMDAQGHFEMTYPSGSNKPPGSYTWYAIDGPTGIKSNVVTYTIK